jgi:hypothetical protein
VATAAVAAAASAPYGPSSSVPVVPSPQVVVTPGQAVVTPGGGANTGFSAPATGLAFTGTEVVVLVAIAAAALALGGMFVLAARRRSQAAGPTLSGTGT